MHSSGFSEISEKQKPKYFTTKLLEKANELSLLFLQYFYCLRRPSDSLGTFSIAVGVQKVTL